MMEELNNMTEQDALMYLKDLREYCEYDGFYRDRDALDVAIKMLKDKLLNEDDLK